MSTIRILIVEDNAVYRRTLVRLIESNAQMECIGAFGSAESFLKSHQSSPPIADIILLDLRLPGQSGLSLIPTFKCFPNTPRIIVITQDDDYRTTLEAIRMGVSGYTLKSSNAEEIERAILEVNDGGCVIDPTLSRLVLDSLGPTKKDGPLSQRECEILERLALGYQKKEIATQLNISYRTVAQHTENIYIKLKVPNAVAAVAKAVRKGLI